MALDPRLLSIDTTAVRDAFSGVVSDAHTRDLLELAVQTTKSVWRQAVSGQVLPPMDRAIFSDAYAAAIDDPTNVTYGRDEATITLTGFPEAESIESGYPAYDMKPGFLASSKAHTGSGGHRYLDIPFRHGTPVRDAKREGPSPRAHFAQTMTPAVYDMARKLRANSGDRLLDPEGLRQVKPQVGAMQNPYLHKTSKHAGMQKLGGKGNTRYLSFRRVSDTSDPASWWHPGVPPLNVIAGVIAHVQQLMPQIVAAYLEVVLGEPYDAIAR